MTAKLVVAKTFSNDIEAETVRSLLESEGLDAFVFRDDAGGMYPSFDSIVGVKLLVPEDQLEDALEILRVDETEPSDEGEDDEEGEGFEGGGFEEEDEDFRGKEK